MLAGYKPEIYLKDLSGNQEGTLRKGCFQDLLIVGDLLDE